MEDKEQKFDNAVHTIMRVCRENDGLCMDNDNERLKLTAAIVEALADNCLI